MKKIAFVVILSLVAAVSSFAKVDTLRISAAYTTHVIFSTDLTYADLSNTRWVGGKIIEQNKNMLALKAKEPFTQSCSVSALESNGTMHTFIVVYEQHPLELVIDVRPKQTAQVFSSPTARMIQESRKGEEPKKPSAPSASSSGYSGMNYSGGAASRWKTGSAPVLSEVIQQPQLLFHIGCKEYDIQTLVEDISSYNDITYMIISVKNNSGISYDTEDATFVIESKSNGRKRTVQNEKTVFPKNRHGRLSAAPGEYTRVAYSFDKMTLSKDQVLKIYLYETNGQRNLVMTVSAKDINKARTNI